MYKQVKGDVIAICFSVGWFFVGLTLLLVTSSYRWFETIIQSFLFLGVFLYCLSLDFRVAKRERARKTVFIVHELEVEYPDGN